MLIDDSELAFGEIKYERRLVCFFDILGWHGHISEAGSDPRRIARLNFFINMFSVFEKLDSFKHCGGEITSFSDNVVTSIIYEESLLEGILISLAKLQAGAALMGFYLRGSVTIGDLVHTRSAVFGPALNRAHEIESKECVYPRMLLDGNLKELSDIDVPFVEKDGDSISINPFKIAFLEELHQRPIDIDEVLKKLEENLNINIPAPTSVSGETLSACLMHRLNIEIEQDLSDRAKEKLVWLRSKILEEMKI